MQNVMVIGGGQSAGECDLKTVCKRGYTIAVNDSFYNDQHGYMPCDTGLSMDRRWSEYRLDKIRGRDFWLRRCEDTWEGRHLYDCDHKQDMFSDIPGVLNGRNSGHVAFNLAYQQRPKRIFLFGFDMSRNYWYPPYPWVNPKREGSRILDTWVSGMNTAKWCCDQKNIEVFIVGHSKIKAFPKLDFRAFLAMTAKA